MKSFRRSRRRTRASGSKMVAVEQIVRTFSAANRLSAVMGIVLGGIVPIACYDLGYFRVALNPFFQLIAIGGPASVPSALARIVFS